MVPKRHRHHDQQAETEQEAEEDVDRNGAVEVRQPPVFCRRNRTQPIPDAIEKMGMYIAMTRPPMTTPRNTMMMGSIILVRFSTA